MRGENTRGEKNGKWLGDAAGYGAIHMWLKRAYPKTGRCDECGAEGRTEYAFMHHPKPHTRERSDYTELCAPCHRRIDLNGNVTHCKHGHELTPENTYSPPGSRSRVCRECRKINSRRRRRIGLGIADSPERWRVAA